MYYMCYIAVVSSHVFMSCLFKYLATDTVKLSKDEYWVNLLLISVKDLLSFLQVQPRLYVNLSTPDKHASVFFIS